MLITINKLLYSFQWMYQLEKYTGHKINVAHSDLRKYVPVTNKLYVYS